MKKQFFASSPRLFCVSIRVSTSWSRFCLTKCSQLNRHCNHMPTFCIVNRWHCHCTKYEISVALSMQITRAHLQSLMHSVNSPFGFDGEHNHKLHWTRNAVDTLQNVPFYVFNFQLNSTVKWFRRQNHRPIEKIYKNSFSHDFNATFAQNANDNDHLNGFESCENL